MPESLKIKVCGMRDPGNIRQVSELMPDYMGFIFYPESKRFCGALESAVIRSLPHKVTPVAVSVDMDEDELLTLVARLDVRIVQLHGNESPDSCRRYREKGLTVWKAVALRDVEDLVGLEKYEGRVDAFLFDTPTAGFGGSGKKFNWDILEGYSLGVPFMLSGGIGPDDVDAVKNFEHSMFVGIDLNSRFETSPAMKDANLLKTFFQSIRQ